MTIEEITSHKFGKYYCPECRKMNNSTNEVESNVHSTMNADDSLLMSGNRLNVCCDSSNNNNCSTNNKEEFMVLN
jgi:hypothetical protein